MNIGVLAVQGSFSLHINMLESMGVQTAEVRRPNHLQGLDGIIIPGGESTTFQITLDQHGLTQRLSQLIHDGMPTWGTCAGAIMLGRGEGKPQPRWELIDIEVQRNAYGRQVDSFVTPIRFRGLENPFNGVFIRAPRFCNPGRQVEILSELDGEPIAAIQRNIMITAFHPELTPDDRIHRYFVESVCATGCMAVAG
jgi:5'-phosphate synthase pdxT subunit